MNYNLIPLDVVKSITGATRDDVAATQGRAIVGMLQAYLGLVLVKQDFFGEKITVPYPFSRVLKPRYAPINDICSVNVLTSEGTYKAETGHLVSGEFTIEILPMFWDVRPHHVLPSSVSAVELSYNAGLYASWAEVPGILQEAAMELLKYKYNAGYDAGFQSEHFGDYSYTKGGLVKGIPVEIAGMLDGLDL